MTTNKGDPPRLGRKPWLEGAKERHKDPRRPADGPDGGSSKRTGSSDNGDDTPTSARESHEIKEKKPSQKSKSATKSTSVVYKSHSLRSSVIRDTEFIRLMMAHGPKHLEFDRFLELASFLVRYSEQKDNPIVCGTIVCTEEHLRQTPCSASNRMQPRRCKSETNPPSASSGPTADSLESKWSALKESVSELSEVILNNDNDSDQEEDTGREYRPKNVKIALALLPMFKETCGSVYPLPAVRTSCDGSIEFAWTNRQTLSRVVCFVRSEEKEREVSIAKFVVHGEKAFEDFPFSVDNQASRESIRKVLLSCLTDAL